MARAERIARSATLTSDRGSGPRHASSLLRLAEVEKNGEWEERRTTQMEVKTCEGIETGGLIA